MRLYTAKNSEETAVYVGYTGSGTVYPLSAYGMVYADMNDLIVNGQADLPALRNAPKSGGVPLASLTLCAPIEYPRQDVLCLGINYLDHAKEADNFKGGTLSFARDAAIYFSKRVNKATAPGGIIPRHADIVDSLDYEVELAVILGKDAKDVLAENAFDYVLGYSILNDVSARNIQAAHKQWYFGKSLDGFTPLGPCIVTADEFAVPPQLRICSTVNGEVRQSSNTSLLITNIAEVLAEITRGITLQAGTIIAMGTPAGVSMGFNPPKWLQPGDTVTCEIEGIGQLTNTVGE